MSPFEWQLAKRIYLDIRGSTYSIKVGSTSRNVRLL